MVDQARARKLAKRIGAIVATAIDHEIKDPRLSFVTVTDTKVTLTCTTPPSTTPCAARRLTPSLISRLPPGSEKAKGALRTKVGAGTGVRFTPTLTFRADTVPDTARHMEDLLERARVADEELARARANAKPAGDPDPYKAPREVADTDSHSAGSTPALDGHSAGSTPADVEPAEAD